MHKKRKKKLRKTMKKWQIENSEKSEISEKLFRVFEKLGFKNLGKKISEISEVFEFSTWPVKILQTANCMINYLFRSFNYS